MQTVGIGENNVAGGAGPCPLAGRTGPVVGGGYQVGDIEGGGGSQLVMGQGLGGVDEDGPGTEAVA